LIERDGEVIEHASDDWDIGRLKIAHPAVVALTADGFHRDFRIGNDDLRLVVAIHF